MKKNKSKKILIIAACFLLLTGCTKTLKDKDKKPITNESTGQSITENIICRPTDKDVIKIYEDNNVKLSKLPECDEFTPLSKYVSNSRLNTVFSIFNLPPYRTGHFLH